MLSSQDSVIELKKYLKKLRILIENDAIFTLFKVKIVDKKKVDDLLCCIESSFPAEYKVFVNRVGSDRVKSHAFYNKLLGAIKNKFMFSTDVYAVNHKDALGYIVGLQNALSSDIENIFRLSERF